MLRKGLLQNMPGYDDSAKMQVPSDHGYTATAILHCLPSDLSADSLIQSQPLEYRWLQASYQLNCCSALNSATVWYTDTHSAHIFLQQHHLKWIQAWNNKP